MDWLWWIIGTLGVGGALLALAIFIVGWPAIIGTKIGRTLLMIGAAILTGLGIYAKGQHKGRLAERAKLKARIAREIRDAKKAKAKIDAMTDDQVMEELKKWDR